MICLELNWLFSDPSWMLQISEFVWSLRSLAWVVFNNFLLIDATDRSKISSDQKRLFFALRLYPLSFFASTPFKVEVWTKKISHFEPRIFLIKTHSSRYSWFQTDSKIFISLYYTMFSVILNFLASQYKKPILSD